MKNEQRLCSADSSGSETHVEVFLAARRTREQVNEWKEAIGIPNEVIQDNISAIFKRRRESETRVFCDHFSFFSFHQGIQMRQAVKMDVQGVTLGFLI